jgi:hypothetical protein
MTAEEKQVYNRNYRQKINALWLADKGRVQRDEASVDDADTVKMCTNCTAQDCMGTCERIEAIEAQKAALIDAKEARQGYMRIYMREYRAKNRAKSREYNRLCMQEYRKKKAAGR